MFRNCLSSAWSNLIRNPWQSAIAIGGLALGLAAAILAGIVAVNQFSYDHFLPDYQRTFYATMVASLPERPNAYIFNTPHDLAPLLQQNFPQIEAVARMGGRGDHSLRRGVVESRENILEADPNIFQILKLPVLFGRLDTALARPDGIVIPRSTALKYFGRANPVGQSLQLDRQHPLTVTAVIEDVPENSSELLATIFTSGSASYSKMAKLDRDPDPNRRGNFLVDVITLVRLKAGVSSTDVEAQLATRSKDIPPHDQVMTIALHLTRLDQYHLSPDFQPGVLQRVTILGTVAFVILLLACINFVNLFIARSARRGVEIGIRKAAGAARLSLITQFLGEAILYVMLALCAGIALAELGLPAVNAFLNAGAVFDYWRNPALTASLLGGALVVGLLAGLYPALVLSSFRPQTVLKGLKQRRAELGLVREALVTLQFTILIVLIIAAATLYQQYQYLTTQALRLDTDQTLFIHAPRCDSGFKDQVAALPGVHGIACSGQDMLYGSLYGRAKDQDGNNVSVLKVTLGPGLLELYGAKPLAGRFFSRDHAGDTIPADAPNDFVMKAVINETAVKKLGLGSAQAAIGHQDFSSGRPITVIGVAPDFSLASSQKPIDPTFYFADDATLNPQPPNALNVLLHVKLDGRRMPETLTAIDRAWNTGSANGPIQRVFMNSYMENLWISLLRESQAIFVFAGIAVFLACLGLFALSLSAMEQRIKEIGIRKAMGATTGEIVMLLLWDFGKPALWANVIAWPLAWWLLQRWLSGFAYHVSLALWPFLAASAAALVIALLTVSGHALLVARQKPVLALRYE